MKIYATTPKHRVVSIRRKTKAKVLQNVEVGDIIAFAVPIKSGGIGCGGRGQTYASTIFMHNLTKNESVIYTFNTVSIVFDVLELEEENNGA